MKEPARTDASGLILPRALGLVVLSVAAAAVAFWQAAHVKVLSDFSYILEYAYRITRGDAPYRDFIIPHPPLTFLLQAAVIALFPGGLTPVWWYCGLAAAATTALTYHIVFVLFGGSETPGASVRAFVLAAPIVFLNGYAIVAMPFYDPDCTLLVLIAIAVVLSARRHVHASFLPFMAGMLLVAPLFAKQNIGLAALVAIHGLLIVSAIAGRSRTERRAYGFVLGGSGAALALAALAIQIWAGLGNYLHWTVAYAAERRWPSAGLLVSLYGHARTWITAACALMGYAIVRRTGGARWAVLLGAIVIALPLVDATHTIVRWGLAARSYCFWGLGVIAGGAAAIADARDRRWRFEALLPVGAVLIAHAAFASQGLADSSYGVWPLLAIGILPAAGRWLRAAGGLEPRRMAAAFLIAVSAALTGLGYRHVAKEERIRFADMSGVVQQASWPALRGLATPGSYIADFEHLLRRTDALIPHDDGVVTVPGEDSFFFATKRRPRFPILLFDDTAVPYDTATLMRLLDAHDVKWVIVKTERQLLNRSWTPLDAFMTTDLPARYDVVDRVPRYLILRRR